MLPSALPPPLVAALAQQLQALLPALDFAAPATHPSAPSQRRVFEVAPPSCGTGCGAWDAAWAALAASAPLARALDALLGEGAWELPCNGPPAGSASVRHFYAPITAPERPAAGQQEGQAGAAAAAAAGGACPAPRPCPFLPMAAWAAGALPSAAPARAWAPVSRRRHVGTGWHLDIGPGASPEAARSAGGGGGAPPDAHRAGAVLLVALSDWLPGGGGTALLPGSHAWVAGELRARAARGAPPPSHQELNLFFAQQLRARTEAGGVLLPSCACGAALAGGGGGGRARPRPAPTLRAQRSRRATARAASCPPRGAPPPRPCWRSSACAPRAPLCCCTPCCCTAARSTSALQAPCASC